MPDWELSNNLVNLIGHLAWPVTLLIALLLIRRHINAILKALSKRIENPDSALELGPSGLSLSATKQGKTATARKIDDAIRSDPALEGRLIDWLKNKEPGLTPTGFIYNSKHEDLREQAVVEFNLR